MKNCQIQILISRHFFEDNILKSTDDDITKIKTHKKAKTNTNYIEAEAQQPTHNSKTISMEPIFTNEYIFKKSLWKDPLLCRRSSLNQFLNLVLFLLKESLLEFVFDSQTGTQFPK